MALFSSHGKYKGKIVIMNKKGFTLAETMLVLTVLGIIAAVLVPTIMHSSPKKNKILFVKSYHEAERTIADLVDDERFYPEPEGFAWRETVDVDGATYTGDTKFCNSFASKINTLGNINCNVAADQPNFTATSGTTWYIPKWSPTLTISPTTGERTITSGSTAITIDVNGSKAPNCRGLAYNETTGKVTTISCKNPDRFVFNVMYNGRIVVDGPVERGYLTDFTKSK